MQPRAERILTTHSGSLPRPAEFLPLVLAQEAGEPVDEARFAGEVRTAVRETVQRQADAGAILEYFAPLKKWLDEQNKGMKAGW